MNANLTDIDYRVQIAQVKKSYEPELKAVKAEKKKLYKEFAKKFDEQKKIKSLRNKEVNKLKAFMYIDSDIYPKPEMNVRYKIKHKNEYHFVLGREFYGNISIMVVGETETKYHCVVFDSERDTVYLKVKKHKMIKFLCKKLPTFSRQLRLNKLLVETESNEEYNEQNGTNKESNRENQTESVG